MHPIANAVRTLGFTLLVLVTANASSATEPCEEFRKQVSVDGGGTWFDADDAASAPIQELGGAVEYRFIVTNCSDNKKCANTTIVDDDLLIDSLTPGSPLGFLDPLEQIIVTKDDAGFENLDQPDRCDTPGIKMNKATETTEIFPSSPVEVEMFMDEAFVQCGPPEIIIEKFTNGHDGDNANGNPDPAPGSFDPGAPSVAEVPSGNPITWTYEVTNIGAEALEDVVVTDSRGVDVSCPLGSPQVTIIDNGDDPGYSASGSWSTFNGQGNEGDFDFRNIGNGTDPASWEFEGLTAGTYRVSVTWVPFTNRVDDATYSVLDGASELGAVVVDQTQTPASFVEGGVAWQDLGFYQVVGDTLEVQLSDLASPTGDPTGSRVIADAVRIETGGLLAPGETITCTAMGSADDLELTGGDVDGCGAQGQGMSRPTYENLGSVEARGTTSGVFVEDDDPSHYCNPVLPPDCGLTVDKTCAVPPPPPGPDDKCDGKLTQFTMIWDGPNGIQVSGPANDSGGSVDNGDVVTFFGPFSQNDVIVGVSGAVSGQSKFHTSCSDKDMDGATETNEDQQQVSSQGRDCGKDQGDGKGSSGINDWLLEGFVDNNGDVLDCTGAPTDGATSCEFTPAEASCETLGKPSNLTLQYTGGGCPGNNSQGSKSDCSGSVNPGLPATVTLDGGTLGSVNPGETFIVPTTGSNTRVVLSNIGGTQTNDIHTSCSAPLAAADSFGSLTLQALDGVGNGSDIMYEYVVSNLGAVTVSNITVDDDQLGFIGSIGSLAPGDSASLSASAFITSTTTNVATVDGDGPPGAMCEADSNPVVVTVLPPPPCTASIAFKEVKDDAVKWTLSNGGGNKATMDTFRLAFPSGFTAIKEVKLDGAVFKSKESSTFPNGVGSGELIGSNDWTESKVSKRELDPGESRTLEVKFTKKFKNASASDFDLNVTFAEGCMVDF